MGCETALSKAWVELEELAISPRSIIQFLAHAYEVNMSDRTIIQRSSLLPAEDYLSVLFLHYLIGCLKHGYRPSSDWISFKDIWGGDTYFPAYRKNTIRPLIERLQQDPDGLIRKLIASYKGKVVDGGDTGVELETFPGVFIRIVIWRGEDEIPPEATILFDRNLTDVLSTEDIAVFLDSVVHRILEDTSYIFRAS
ncbi:MAG: DUF3786 domain-containing protein [Methanotrichaceae archaeon]